MPTKELSKIVRVGLAGRYGARNVSVTKGLGTASGWVDARIQIKKPYDCICSDGRGHCRMCMDTIQRTADEARKIAHGCLEKQGEKFNSYCDDMGEDRECFCLQVRIKQGDA